MNPFKAVVFDFGGVMTTSVMPERVRNLVSELGIDWTALERGFAHYRRLMDGGFIDLETMYSIIWADAGIEIDAATQARIIEEDMSSFLERYRNLRTLNLMKSLKAAGYKVGILTNMPRQLAVRFKVTFADFIQVADAMVISGEEHMFKPQRRIYRLLEDRIGLKGEDLVFVDDVEGNCAGAAALGWQTLLFKSNDQAEREFAPYLISK